MLGPKSYKKYKMLWGIFSCVLLHNFTVDSLDHLVALVCLRRWGLKNEVDQTLFHKFESIHGLDDIRCFMNSHKNNHPIDMIFFSFSFPIYIQNICMLDLEQIKTFLVLICLDYTSTNAELGSCGYNTRLGNYGLCLRRWGVAWGIWLGGSGRCLSDWHAWLTRS